MIEGISEILFEIVHMVEVEVGKEALADDLPEIFNGIELRAVGRQREQGDVGRDLELVGTVGTGSVQEQSDVLEGIACGELLEESGKGFLVHGRQNEEVTLAIGWTDCAIGIGVLPGETVRQFRAASAGRPAAP